MDPTGLKSALVISGKDYRSNSNSFHEKAQSRVQNLKESSSDIYDDGIYWVDGSTFDNWQDALKEYKDISLIEYYGHGDSNGLYLNNDKFILDENGNKQKRSESILANGVIGDNFTDGTSDHHVTDLFTGNTTDDLEINLYSCHAGQNGGVAGSFADHFGAGVYAAKRSVNFDGFKPYVDWWKIGGFRWIFPSNNDLKRYNPKEKSEKSDFNSPSFD